MAPQSGLLQRLGAVPARPGVYILKGAPEEILYVGKAGSLRSRLRSYFGSPVGLTPKVRTLVQRVGDFEYIVTESEQEALLLENTFIKRHRPPFNARLKDDKTYPYLKITLQEPFPQVLVTRRLVPDGARYFGPFASASSIRKTMELLKKLFPYRSCTKAITGTDPRPCLDYYIHRCVGPCIGAASQQEYREVTQQVILFLEGRTERVVRALKAKMEQAVEGLQFERAGVVRDQLRAIERVTEGQKVFSTAGGDEDVIALARGYDEAWVEVFSIRHGRLIGRDHFIMEGAQDEEDNELLQQFVKQYYDSASSVPPRLVLQHPLPETDLIQRWLSEKQGRRVQLRVPQRGEARKQVLMVEENAREGLEQLKVKWQADTEAMDRALAELQEQLSLPRLPHRMECYDISNIQGTNPVGSMVVFEGGQPKPAHYRRFKIKTVTGVDDYSMMREMLRRRFRHLGRSVPQDGEPAGEREDGRGPSSRSEAWGVIPDLAVIDGGKGHLNVAQEVFLELGIDFIPLSSLAKEREEIFVPHSPDPIVLPRSSSSLFLMQRIRDEAHRFAITYHRKVRGKRAVESALDLVPGIGPRRKRRLLRQFGSINAIREAPVAELAAVPGMTVHLAEKVKEYL